MFENLTAMIRILIEIQALIREAMKLFKKHEEIPEGLKEAHSRMVENITEVSFRVASVLAGVQQQAVSEEVNDDEPKSNDNGTEAHA